MKVLSNTDWHKAVTYSVDELRIIKRIREQILRNGFDTNDCPESARIAHCVPMLMEQIPADFNTPDGRLILSHAVRFLLEPVKSEKSIKEYEQQVVATTAIEASSSTTQETPPL